MSENEKYAMYVAENQGLKVLAGGKVFQFKDGKLELRGDDVDEFAELCRQKPIVLSKCKQVNFEEAERLVQEDMLRRRPAAVAGAFTTQPHSDMHADMLERRRAEEFKRMGVDPKAFEKEGLTLTEHVELPPRGTLAAPVDNIPQSGGQPAQIPQTSQPASGQDFVKALQDAQGKSKGGGLKLPELKK